MLDLQDIASQTSFDTDTATPEAAAERVRVERWTPHVEDGLDAFARVVRTAEADKWARVVMLAGSDPSFRRRLLDDPTETLRGFGIVVPAHLEFKVIEDTETVRHLVLPAPGRALGPEEVGALAEHLAFATGTTLLPQCWADTWKATMPADRGRPVPDRPIDRPIEPPVKE